MLKSGLAPRVKLAAVKSWEDATSQYERDHFPGYVNWRGKCKITELLKIPNSGNVRELFPTLTEVHKSILNTLLNEPHMMSVRNNGITLTAIMGDRVTKDGKTLEFLGLSLDNGAQTKGMVEYAVNNIYAKEPKNFPDLLNAEVFVNVHVIDNHEFRDDICISTNSQNGVKAISVANKKGEFDELESSLTTKYPGLIGKIFKKETDDKQKKPISVLLLIQLLIALTPPELAKRFKIKDVGVNSYTKKGMTFRFFQKCKNDDSFKELYDFYVEIVPMAFDLYEYWTTNKNKFNWEDNGLISNDGKGSKVYSKDKNGVINKVTPGLVWPIISAYRTLLTCNKDKWGYIKPSKKVMDNMCKAVVGQIGPTGSVNVESKKAAIYDRIEKIINE